MIIEKEKFNILNFIKKDDYTGSYSGMRYLIRSAGKEEMKVYIWPEPYSFSKTDKELIIEKTFPLNMDGLEEARVYLNDQYEAQKALWGLSLGKHIV
ncbi:MAG: hypothetical protein K5888_05615 [Lachnospiraceae bacterium]|nr:hypothetical protein [Lachnospiraceae bacterium]